MAFDLHAIQETIKSHLESELPQYHYFRGVIPEDSQLIRDSDSEVPPFFELQFGPMIPRPRGRSMAGPRNDEYYSWVQVVGIGSDEGHVSAALAVVVDRLIGYKPAGGTPLVPDNGPTDYGSRQYSIRPVMYYQSQRFEFGITQSGLNGYLTP